MQILQCLVFIFAILEPATKELVTKEPPATRLAQKRLTQKRLAQKKITQKECTQIIAELAATRIKTAPKLQAPDSVTGSVKKKETGRLTSSDDHVMPYFFIEKGDWKKDEKRPLYICLHGGGQHKDAPSAHGWPVNTREFAVQTHFARKLYPESGLYFVPRMADDRLGRWRHGHNIELFLQVIRDATVHYNADPDRIYVLGISQGAYGIYVLAPFMADVFAGANPMTCASDTDKLPNLRNLAFRTDIGELDTTYDRIGCARRTHAAFEKLKAEDKEGYNHLLAEQKKRGHGIRYDRGQPWLAKHTRNARPDRIGWIAQHTFGHYRKRFYWVGLPEKTDDDKTAWELNAECDREKNQVTVTLDSRGFTNKKTTIPAPDIKGCPIDIFLDDKLLDLDKEITIILNEKTVFTGKVERSKETLKQTFAESQDPAYTFPVKLQFTVE